MKRVSTIILLILWISIKAIAQVNDSKTGAWYMLFWNKNLNESKWGFQGDIQYRNWNYWGDLEQLLLRGGVTYNPTSAIKFTLGYGNISTGRYGESNKKFSESRIYQEALLPQIIGRFFLTHRFRYEQRWVEKHNFRTRYRYNLFLNIPLNSYEIVKNTIYLALYNELFINGQNKIDESNYIDYFDRNRFYSALGYAFNKDQRLQLGYMEQSNPNYSKGQAQLSFHLNF